MTGNTRTDNETSDFVRNIFESINNMNISDNNSSKAKEEERNYVTLMNLYTYYAVQRSYFSIFNFTLDK